MKSKFPAAAAYKSALPIFALIISLFISQSLFAQTTFTSRSATSDIKVSGTSNLHDWSMKGSDYVCF
ncbi:MAG: hypothetical protein ACXWB9_06055, partial [Flavisolibacter sp.]